MLYPLSTLTRDVIDLSGLWNFSMGDLKTKVAVPGSFNDQLVFTKYKTYSGDFEYETNFYINKSMLDKRIFVRFGSATHFAQVLVNNNIVGEHKGGFTPFEFEITNVVNLGENKLTVKMNNILDYTTLPVGNYSEKDGIPKVDENFDFFNYSGLQRKVKICIKPQTYLEDVAITYDFLGNDANVNFDLEVNGDFDKIEIEIYDKEKNQVAKAEGKDKISLTIKDVKRWQPLKAYHYTAKVKILKNDNVIDEYDERFGMRSIEVKNGQFLINGEPFYFKGYGRHEDTLLNGRGLNEVANITDMNLMKWQGANSFRTSHYPYSEEMMRLADEEGFVVIDETTAVGLMESFGFTLVSDGKEKPNTWEVMKTSEAHKQVIKELIKRDKNLACVVMWSIANEPSSHEDGAYEYFEPLFKLARELDPQKRPCTLVTIMYASAGKCKVTCLSDVICINRYYGWYVNGSDLPAAKIALEKEIKKWHEIHPEKPIMFTEYGADTVAGLHDMDFNTPFTEEYQVEYYKANHEIIDKIPYFCGEHVWNFADFQTKYGMFRVQGNKKGLFTRERYPKAVAHYFKERWNEIPNFNYKK